MEAITKFDLSKVRFDQENEVTLMIGMKAPSIQLQTQRQPLNLMTVLDISGSMAGPKIEAMKKSIQILIDHLTDKDKLGIVVFSTQVSKLADPASCTPDWKNELKKRVSKLEATDTTNISGATLLAFEALTNQDGNINRVLLFTDGLPNVGISSIPDLTTLVKSHPKGLTLSTFGYGQDHNPELLLSMAKAGDGNFYYIESVDKISTAFAQELGGLLSCYAQNIRIRIEPKSGVIVDEVLNDAYEYDIKDKETEIRIPDMFAEEVKNALLKLKFEKRTSALPREVTVADIEITFTDLLTKKTEKVEVKAKLEFVKEGEESKDKDKEVCEAVITLEAAKAQIQAVQMANMGNFVGAQQLMVNCCHNLSGLGTPRGLGLAEEMKVWSSSLSADHYNQGVAHLGTRAAYSHSTGRAGGQSCGLYAGTSAQRGMAKEFEDQQSPVSSSIHVPSSPPVSPSPTKIDPVKPQAKREKKKSNKPFTERFMK